MPLPLNRRGAMTLFSSRTCARSHRARIVMAEKHVAADVVYAGENFLPEDLVDINPYASLPTFVERDLVLYDSQVIIEYFEERYPHPPLMAADPVSRARTRVYLYRIDHDWYSLLDDITGRDDKAATKARKLLRESLTVAAPIFDKKPYFMSTEFSLVDCVMAALLWRLPHLGVELPPAAKALKNYGERLFERPAFRGSLSEAEIEMR